MFGSRGNHLGSQFCSKRKALGRDGITNSAIKNLSIQYTILARLINAILHFQDFPSSLKRAVIVPINNSGSDPAVAKSY